ncbi:hypothetical protein PMI16_04021 [Herbaspirillum sp. CF444]|uniref:hypothetical protein n=1 Tax=Herbaspirillum sp. CF444 TaxID=1144319 RepID=UPI0002727EFD|nr:hypothetical protein [Herbaspirillum sp. CF444]EJL84280.1 hypothetical protein PMI16_04021 [Herbaspirillum sp. CF444]
MIRTFSRLLRLALVAAATLIGIAPLNIAHAADVATPQKKILYVTRLDLPANASERNKELQQKGMASDTRVRTHLEAMGYAVTFADQSAPPANAEKYDLVILSSVVQSRELTDTAYKDVRVPMLTWENDLFDSLRLTGRKKGEVYGEVEKEHYIRIVNAPHPLAAGLPAGKTYVYPRDTSMGWGTPARSAIVIATLPGDLDKAVIFGYEKGATMDYDFVAPARRVAFFLDNLTFDQLTPIGLRLFDAAVVWALAPAPAKN